MVKMVNKVVGYLLLVVRLIYKFLLLRTNNPQLIVIFCLLFFSCNSDDPVPVPKPKGYLRIVFPEKSYVKYDTPCPFTFEYPTYVRILKDELKNAEPCWINLDFPQFHGTIHMSYKKVDHNLNTYTEDSRTFAVKHEFKASAIDEQVISKAKKKVYGLKYDIRGNTASSIQFYLTDSVTHFVRGALYFNARPNADSLAPVIDFVNRDIDRMIESFEWK